MPGDPGPETKAAAGWAGMAAAAAAARARTPQVLRRS